MRLNTRLNEDFWAEAMNVVCYLVNKSPSIAIELKTPVLVVRLINLI